MIFISWHFTGFGNLELFGASIYLINTMQLNLFVKLYSTFWQTQESRTHNRILSLHLLSLEILNEKTIQVK